MTLPAPIRGHGGVGLAFGAPGTGKTSLLCRVLYELSLAYPDVRVLAFDPVSNVREGLSIEQARHLAPRSIWATKAETLVDLLGTDPRPAIVAVDEAELIWSDNVAGDHPIRRLHEHARNRGLVIVGTTRQPAALARSLRTNARWVAVFRLDSRIDAKGMEASMLPELLGGVHDLPIGSYLYRAPAALRGSALEPLPVLSNRGALPMVPPRTVSTVEPKRMQ